MQLEKYLEWNIALDIHFRKAKSQISHLSFYLKKLANWSQSKQNWKQLKIAVNRWIDNGSIAIQSSIQQ